MPTGTKAKDEGRRMKDEKNQELDFGDTSSLKESILQLYREPAIGVVNTYGEVNIKNLVKKYQGLDAESMQQMMALLVNFSKSEDLVSSYISVGVLHALGMKGKVAEAYDWAKNKVDSEVFACHFDIGVSLADHFIGN